MSVHQAGTDHRPGSDPQVALVTGAASGIGLAAATAFADRGDRVVLADVDDVTLDAAAERLATRVAAPDRIDAVHCDVSDERSVIALLDEIRARHGRLDFAFNNAGVEQRRATVADCTEDNWDRTIAIDLKGIWLSMKHQITLMRDTAAGSEAGGSIVNTSSVVGSRGVFGAPAYVAAKHGIIGLTRCAAVEEAAHRIRVNAVAPGHIRTPLVERVIDKEPAKEETYRNNALLGRLGEADEVASVVTWLCSPASSFVTGEVIAVDGGVLVR